MNTISLNIPTSRKPEAYQEVFTTLINSYELEEIEDVMLALHVIKNNETDVITSADFRKKYASISA